MPAHGGNGTAVVASQLGRPNGLAEFMIRDADACQLDPSRVVETWFFNHPSARNRIFAAMRWRAEHLTP